MERINRSETNKEYSDEVCKNLCEVLGVNERFMRNITKLIGKASIHTVAEQALDKTDGKLKEFVMEIPYLCTLYVTMDRREPVITRTELNSEFADLIKKAVNRGESPLMKEFESKLVETIKQKYNDLL